MEECRDTEFHGECIAIGGAADAAIQILGATVGARHAELVREGSQLELRCARGRLVRVNGQDVAFARLQPGDVVEIGGNRLRSVVAPAGFQFALQIEPDPAVDAGQYEAAFRTSIDQSWLSKRRLSWIALGLVLLLGLAVPLTMAKLMPSANPTEIARQGLAERSLGDALWSTGPLTPAHAQATGNQCGHCHQSLFVRVRDEACSSCHKSIADHVHPEVAKLAGVGAQGRCATCHREHGETAIALAPRVETLCTSCHANARQRFATLNMANVSGFDAKSHPAFSPGILVPDAVDASGWVVHKMPLVSAREQSNLKFSHAQHLDAKHVIRDSDGAALGCGDCHRPAAGGARFLPVTMREACSSCHDLGFDPAEPQRQLPHGRPREVILALQEFFARRYLDPAAGPAARQMRRVPGHEHEEAACTAGALPCARQFASTEIQSQFSERGCVTCHEVVDTAAADIMERFEVRPVRLADGYFPAARFNHAAHRIQKDLGGDAACLSCHSASKSKSSQDVLLPDLPKCAQCHRTHPGREQIETPCFTCHVNHPKGDGMRRSNTRAQAIP